MWWRRRRLQGEHLTVDQKARYAAWADARVARSAERFDAIAASLEAASGALRRTHRGRPVDEVLTALRARLGSDAPTWPDAVMLEVARMVANPFWPLRHPIQFMRSYRGGQTETNEQPTVETESDREFQLLSERLRDRVGVRVVGMSSTEPDTVEVTLEPWSEQSAQVVRGICTPRQVRFLQRTDLPPWILDDLN